MSKYREILRRIEEREKQLSACCGAVTLTSTAHKDCIFCSECGKLWKIKVEIEEFNSEIGLSGGEMKQEGISL
jgi:Fe2+ or Zn2+ uptake regulation protein